MRGFSFLLAVLTLAGCATGPSLQSRMASYTGASGETLVKDLGVPDKQVTLKDVQYLAYVRQQSSVTLNQGVFFATPNFGTFYGPSPDRFGGTTYYNADLPPSVTVWRCETTFRLQDDKVQGFTLRGNDCG